jgi:hypothetical protein
MKLLLREAAPEVPFFGDADEDLESCTRLLTTATLWRPNESVRELLPEYPRIYGKIPDAAIECLQDLVDSVRPEVGPLPAAPQSRPHLYMPWMRIISQESSDRELRSFSLVPHASFSAPFIAVTPTIWPKLQPKIGKRKAPGELRDAFPVGLVVQHVIGTHQGRCSCRLLLTQIARRDLQTKELGIFALHA